MTARILPISAAQYHRDERSADPTDPPSLSASLAKILATQSPAHAYAAHPKLGGKKHEPTKAMSGGTLIHSLVLEAGRGIVVLDFENYKTKAAQEAKAEALATERIPVLVDDMADAVAASVKIRRRLEDAGVLLDGMSEEVIEWHDATADGEPVICRSMLDHRSGGVIYDLKTTASASPDDFGRSVARYGYDIQAAAYQRAVRALRPDLDGRIEFLFCAVELDEPHAVAVYRPGGDVIELGERRWERAVERWAACLKTGSWPDYSAAAGDRYPWIEMPPWLLRQEEERDE